MPDSVTRFLNVDLELVATFDLAPLLEYFNAETFTLRDSVAEGRRTVWMELHPDPKDTNDAILRYSMLVAVAAQRRPATLGRLRGSSLNVGIQSGFAPHITAFPISTTAMAKLVAIAAHLEITVYSADGEKSERIRPQAT